MINRKLLPALIGTVTVVALFIPAATLRKKAKKKRTEETETITETNPADVNAETLHLIATLTKPQAEYGTHHGNLNLTVGETTLPAGTVTVYQNSKVIYTETLPTVPAEGTTFATINLKIGGDAGTTEYKITHTDSAVKPVTLTQVTTKAKTQITKFEHKETENQGTVITAHIKNKAKITPQGEAQLRTNNTVIATTTLNGGDATFTLDSLHTVEKGSKVTIAYLGDSNNERTTKTFTIKPETD